MPGAVVTPPAASAAPSRASMNAAWSARDDHTSDTMKVPSSAVPAACESGAAGQSPAGLHVDAKVLVDSGAVGPGQAWGTQGSALRASELHGSRPRAPEDGAPIDIRRRSTGRITCRVQR